MQYGKVAFIFFFGAILSMHIGALFIVGVFASFIKNKIWRNLAFSVLVVLFLIIFYLVDWNMFIKSRYNYYHSFDNIPICFSGGIFGLPIAASVIFSVAAIAIARIIRKKIKEKYRSPQ
jgi:hypothetical protein